MPCFLGVRMRFDVQHTDGKARVGALHVRGRVVKTPVFMPVGTQASVKGLTPQEVASTGAGICLANTYHLWLRPGADVIRRLGGVRRFMGWPGALLTDSGGFQVYSLGGNARIDDDGVEFRSHIDGSLRRLTPEVSMAVQAALGSDIAMVLDECPSADADRSQVMVAMDRSTAWARRCLDAPHPEDQARFVIMQGGVHVDLRRRHLEALYDLPAEGMAIGGLSVGEPIDEMYRVLDDVAHELPRERPRYLMGVGTPHDLLHAVGAGVDMFDCVLPTRNARNGQAWTFRGRVNLRQARHRQDSEPIDPECECMVCQTWSRAYLRHLFMTREMLGPRLVTLHNLHFYGQLTAGMRRAIERREYSHWAEAVRGRMLRYDEVGAPRDGESVVQA